MDKSVKGGEMKGSKGPTKIKIIIESPTEIITYKSPNVQVIYNIEKHFEEFGIVPWSMERAMVEIRSPTLTLTVQPLGLRSTTKKGKWFTLDFKKRKK